MRSRDIPILRHHRRSKRGEKDGRLSWVYDEAIVRGSTWSISTGLKFMEAGFLPLGVYVFLPSRGVERNARTSAGKACVNAPPLVECLTTNSPAE